MYGALFGLEVDAGYGLRRQLEHAETGGDLYRLGRQNDGKAVSGAQVQHRLWRGDGHFASGGGAPAHASDLPHGDRDLLAAGNLQVDGGGEELSADDFAISGDDELPWTRAAGHHHANDLLCGNLHAAEGSLDVPVRVEQVATELIAVS